MERFPEKLKLARKKAQMTQADLAERIGVTVRSVTDYERGATVPRAKKLNLIAKALGVSTVYLTNDAIDDPEFGARVQQKMNQT
ncbi:MAG: helix-turn-helix transcriptional regulator, partial [Clostridia bacterium]|nr:helix-turn-helix transcriptional regulator [Clostridia bacterium]